MKGAKIMDIKALVEDFKKLTTEECEILIRELTKILRGDTDTLKSFLTNERFSGGASMSSLRLNYRSQKWSHEK